MDFPKARNERIACSPHQLNNIPELIANEMKETKRHAYIPRDSTEIKTTIRTTKRL